MKTSSQFLGLCLAVSTLALTGCANFRGNQMVGEKIDDKIVTSRVKDILGDSPVYKFEDVNVATHGRVVQLSGWVDKEEQKVRAAELARQVPDVRGVINSIALKPHISTQTQESKDSSESEGKGGTAE